MNNTATTSNIERCWQIVGTDGDRSCPELSTVTHCVNCPIYSAIGSRLLERTTPDNYRQEWTDLIAQPHEKAENKSIIPSEISHFTYGLTPQVDLTVVIFRLHQEWLAISAQVFQQATLPSKVHTLPHRSNQVLKGLVNIRGELYLCVSLNHLLNIGASNKSPLTLSPIVYPRMLVLAQAGNTWVFAVDELYGLHHLHPDELQNPPHSLASTSRTYTKGLFFLHSRSVSYLDEELLFTTLRQKVLL